MPNHRGAPHIWYRPPKARKSQAFILASTWRVSEIAEDLDILDALIALHETLQRRETERMHESARRREEHTQLQASAEQGQATEGDAGWDF